MGQVPAPEGIDAAGVERWFLEHVGEVALPLAFARVPGGRSNLTFRVSDSLGRCWVLRRPPLSSRLPSAHDMRREHRIQSALASTTVPVPRMLGHCADETVTGAEFYVMEYVDGLVLADRTTAQELDERARRAAGMNLVDTLVALHEVDPDGVDLGDLARRDGYVERQLRRWHGQLQAQKVRELPAMDEVHALLATRVPAQERTRIVHGDYRLDNTVLSVTGAVRAVLDWELCTLGDPLADVGMLLVYWSEPGDRVLPLGQGATLEPGFPSRKELLERYRWQTGAEADIEFYVAFAYWRLAAILEGVYARQLAGAYGEAEDDVERYGRTVVALAAEAWHLLH